MDPTISPYSIGSSVNAAETALQPLLDAFAQQEHSADDLTMGLTSVCAQFPSATWQALSLLDQYHRRRVLPTELFFEIKKQLNSIAFGAAGAHVDVEGQTYARSRARRTHRTASLGTSATAQRSPDSTAQHTLRPGATISRTAAFRTSALHTSALNTSALHTSALHTSRSDTAALRTAARDQTRDRTRERAGRTGDSPLQTSALDYSQLALPTPEQASSFLDREMGLDREMDLDRDIDLGGDSEQDAEVERHLDREIDAPRFTGEFSSVNEPQYEAAPQEVSTQIEPEHESQFAPSYAFDSTSEPQNEPNFAAEDLTAESQAFTHPVDPAPTQDDSSATGYVEADYTASRMPFVDARPQDFPNLTMPRRARTAPESFPAVEPQSFEPATPLELRPPLAPVQPIAPVQIEQVHLERVPDPHWARSHSPRAGTVLNERYMLIEPVVSGSISTVFKALDYQRSALPESERYVAIKCPQEALQSDPRAAAALHSEYSQVQTISHPNIAKVYDYYADETQSYIVMELLQGESLDWILERMAPRRLPVRRALAVIREIGNALAHAHDRGVMHGNLHTGSITITRAGDLRVADFGQAIAWQSPTVAGELRPADDLYNLARIAHELLCGCGPEHRAINGREKEGRDKDGHDKERPHYAKHLSTRQWRALQHGLSDTRLQRPSKVRDWLAELDLSTADIRLPPLAVLESQTANDSRIRRDVAWLAAGVAGAAVVALGAWAVFSGSDEQTSPPSQPTSQQISQTEAAQTSDVAGPAISDEAIADAQSAEPGTLAEYTDRLAASSTRPPAQMENDANARDAWEKAQNSLPASALEAAAASLPFVSFSSSRYEVAETQPAARLVIQRTGPADRELILRWYSIPDTAQPDRDYVSNERSTIRIPAGKQSAEIFIPLVRGQPRDRAISFSVRIGATSQALPGRSVSTQIILMPSMTSTPKI